MFSCLTPRQSRADLGTVLLGLISGQPRHEVRLALRRAEGGGTRGLPLPGLWHCSFPFPGFGGAEVHGGIFQQAGAWTAPVLGHECWLQATETDSGYLKKKIIIVGKEPEGLLNQPVAQGPELWGPSALLLPLYLFIYFKCKKYVFIYLFGCVGSWLQHAGWDLHCGMRDLLVEACGS